jgi:hypothetical protein
MYTGAISPLRLERVFGVTTFELGSGRREIAGPLKASTRSVIWWSVRRAVASARRSLAPLCAISRQRNQPQFAINNAGAILRSIVRHVFAMLLPKRDS